MALSAYGRVRTLSAMTDPTKRERAALDVLALLPDWWTVGPTSYGPGTGRWTYTARGPHPGQGTCPETLTGTGEDELAAKTDLRMRLDERQRAEKLGAIAPASTPAGVVTVSSAGSGILFRTWLWTMVVPAGGCSVVSAHDADRTDIKRRTAAQPHRRMGRQEPAAGSARSHRRDSETDSDWAGSCALRGFHL
jgi:hypothetical protein